MPRSPARTALPWAAAAAEEIRRIVRALALSGLAVERASGLSGAQAFVLRALARRGPATPSELAARALTDASSVTGVVAKLEAKGLVARRRDPEDGRRVVLSIRPAGRARLRRAPVPVQERLLAGLERIPEAQLRVLVRVLGSVVETMGAARRAPTLFFEEPPRPGRRRRRR